MRRFELVTLVNTGPNGWTVPAAITGSWTKIAEDAAHHAVIKRNLPDGTPTTALTLADLDSANNAIGVKPDPITSAQRAAIKAQLVAFGIPVVGYDAQNFTDRKTLTEWLIGVAMAQPSLVPLLVSGWEANDGIA